MIPINLIRQYHFCPRIVYFNLLTNIKPIYPRHVSLGDAYHQMQEKLGVNKIRPPTLYLHGENDGCIAANLSEGMEANFEDLEIKILPDCGHFLHLEKPDEVNKIILDFLSG